ncbi:adenylyltransferase/cytidyltransferase family protein [Geodermatophilus sp. SYSU D00698]
MSLGPPPVRVVTFGTFDVFHAGHLRLLERAAALGDELVVGISSDELNLSKKGRSPVYSLADRMAIVGALRASTASSSNTAWRTSAGTSSSSGPTSS